MDEITVHGGIRGTRILAAAFATVELRKRGRLKPSDGRQNPTIGKIVRTWGKRAGRPWLPSDVAEARRLRAAGRSNEQIGKAISRSAISVYHKIGPCPFIGRMNGRAA